ncbi:MAG: hypothetical protein GY755_06245, partial [Chloroflexi bacterium]|nr:hypothetical protein [Chloroflexota bacterium]
GENAPVDLTFDNERWTCQENRRGKVTGLRLSPDGGHDWDDDDDNHTLHGYKF